jgi:hypothetical protein
MKKTKAIAFDFAVEKLEKINPLIKPMFGCHALYVEEKIMLILRKKENNISDNGVWVATTPDHHESLRKEFPSLRSIKVFGTPESGWQVMPEEANDFEENVIKICELILRRDLRIGKVPGQKKPKKTKKGLND